jgi:uncharacterized protein YndB with AHSA1/START domain
VRRAALLIAALIVVAVTAGATRLPHRAIVTEIDIAKPPSEVWAVLTDTASYPAWNPGMRLIGQLEPGQVIEHDQGEGSDRAIFHPTVQTVRPQE